jgi:hypothetical protein
MDQRYQNENGISFKTNLQVEEMTISEDVLADGKIDKEDVKHILASRTLWVNLLAFVGFFLQSKYGYVIDEALQAELLTLINVGLRCITSKPITWK